MQVVCDLMLSVLICAWILYYHTFPFNVVAANSFASTDVEVSCNRAPVIVQASFYAHISLALLLLDPYLQISGIYSEIDAPLLCPWSDRGYASY